MNQLQLPILQHKKKAMLVLLLGLTLFFKKKHNSTSIVEQWRRVAQIKHDKLHQAKQKFLQEYPTEIKMEILNANVTILRQFIKDKKYTIPQIVAIFITQSIHVGIQNNWIMTPLFNEAMNEANLQQQQFDEDPTIIDRHYLFGIPITIKDFISIKDVDSTFGLAASCFNPSPIDGREVAAIRRERGIIFLKSSVPQIGMSMETNNHIMGRAMNPFSLSRSTGGSSGGEAGLLGAKCSILSLGSDAAGSLRNPASFCGVLSYKPASVRVGVARRHTARKIYTFLGNKSFPSITGPMARHIDDLVLMTKIQFEPTQNNYKSVDPHHKMFPFNEEIYYSNSKLKIGWIKSLNLVPACAACQRGVGEAISKLTAQGHQVVEFKLPDNFVEAAMRLTYKLLLADQTLRGYYQATQGEPFIREYDSFLAVSKLPKWLIKTFAKGREGIIAEGFLKNWDAGDLLEFQGKLQEMKFNMNNMWKEQGLDALITPVSAGVAYKHGQSKDGTLAVAYLLLWSLFDFNAGVVPIGTVREDEQYYNAQYNDKLDKCLIECMKDSAGLPVGVQVVTMPFEDEICLKVMKDICQN